MKKGFTLAEVLITLAIIGVVAALTIPSVILNTNQTEYKTALKKAVSVLNQAVSLELALENISPSEATTVADFIANIQQQMNTVSSATGDCDGMTVGNNAQISSTQNHDACSFTTTDGMQFAFAANGSEGFPQTCSCTKPENPSANACTNENATTQTECAKANGDNGEYSWAANQCTLGANGNGRPCIMLVDVNGDKNPNRITTNADAPTDRFYIQFGGSNGTTVTPVGAGSQVMFGR